MLKFNHKEIRAKVIKEYMKSAGYDKAICFSCGNGARALENIGVNVLHIGKYGELTPNKWYSQKEILNKFSDYFDATSGHLNMELMLLIAKEFKNTLGDIPDNNDVPCGSGETLVCLKLAYPEKHFNAIYNINEATEYNNDAPLNLLVELLADSVYKE